MTTAIYVAAGVLLVANLVANIAVARSSSYTISQKVTQSMLIWLLPLIGTLAVWIILKQISYEPEHRPDHFPGHATGDGYSQGASFGGQGGPDTGSDGGGDGGGGGGE